MLDARLRFHPLTGEVLVPVGHRRDGTPIWPILGGSEPAGQGQQQGQQSGQSDGQQTGQQQGGQTGQGGQQTGQQGRQAATDPSDPYYFPPNTPVAEMTDRQAANYWRHQTKVQQDRVPANFAEIQRRAQEYDELLAQQRTAEEAAVDEALEVGREEGRAEALATAGAEIIRGLLADRGKTEDDIDALMRGIDAAGFLSEDATSLDRAAIRAFVDQLAPAGAGRGGSGPDLGQGRRGGNNKPSVASGRDLFAQRHPNRDAATTSA